VTNIYNIQERMKNNNLIFKILFLNLNPNKSSFCNVIKNELNGKKKIKIIKIIKNY